MTDQNSAGIESDLNKLFPKRINAVNACDLGTTKDITEDETLIEVGRRHRKILLTRDVRTIRRKQHPFKPCTHEGIITLIGMPSDAETIERVGKLVTSGPSIVKQVKGHFTHLRSDGGTIYKENDETTSFRFKK